MAEDKIVEKRLKTRIVHKHETEANWNLATTFVPLQGEIIIYDIDSTHTYERVKVGDGKTLVSALPFIDANKVDKVAGKGLSTNDYTTTEKTKLAGIAEGANKTVVDNALSTSSTNPVQNKVVNTAISDLKTLVGDKKVSEQISTAIANKSDVGHSHDDEYYTESEIDSKLSEKSDTDHTHNYAGSSSAGGAANSVKTKLTVKLNGGSTEGADLFTYNGSTAKTVNITPSAIGAAASSHGNHVPTVQTADNATFLRNDNTWQKVTPANIGAAASSHGTHVSYSTTKPVMDGDASVGSASTVARSDHKHPTDTSRAAASDLTSLKALVGDTKVSEQINTALSEATADDFGVYVQETEPTTAVAGDIWIDTANDPSFIVPTIPEVTQADNGKVLMVVNGRYQLVNLNLSIDANGVVSM